MFPDKFSRNNAHVGKAPLFGLLSLLGLLPMMVSCSADQGAAGAGPRELYAENEPKTKEEKAYYQDVLSGDWKKQATGPLGYFGLGKYQVSTTPPPHWTMEPPTGAKTMTQIQEEKYDARMNREFGENPQRMADASPSRYYSDPRNDGDDRRAAGHERFHAEEESSRNNFHPYDNDSRPRDYEEESSRPYEDSPVRYPGGASSHYYESATPYSNEASSRYPKKAERGYDREDSYREEDYRKIKTSETEKKSFLEKLGFTRFSPMTRNQEKNRFVLRGQEPDSSGREAMITTTADSQEKPLAIDPAVAEKWNRVDGRLIGKTDASHLPRDEYIAEGGDLKGEVYAMPNWDVHNLESEETVAHFDTLSGKILVEPSNRLYIYSPRFGVVRQAVGPKSNLQTIQTGNVETKTSFAIDQREEGVDYRTQETVAQLARGNVQATGLGANQPGGSISGEVGVMENSAQDRLADAVGALKGDVITDEMKAAIADGSAAATAWGEVQGVSVHIDRIAAQGNVTLQGAETIYKIENGTKSSQLRLQKAASKSEAAPGELIEFTLRYENVGGETIGNVTILDSLSPRLSYVDDSARSSRNAKFLVKNNETGSLLLRWEITDPLEPGEFGIISFLCRVR